MLVHVVCLQAVNRGTYQPPKHNGFLLHAIRDWLDPERMSVYSMIGDGHHHEVISFQMTIPGQVMVISILLSFWG